MHGTNIKLFTGQYLFDSEQKSVADLCRYIYESNERSAGLITLPFPLHPLSPTVYFQSKI
jgi:hypothetical protein